MSGAFTTVMEPELWTYVDRILMEVPRHIEVWRYRSDAELIDALGRGGAFDALRAYQAALERYFAGVVFQAIRAAAVRPLAPDRTRGSGWPTTDEEWTRMFELPWLSTPCDA